MLQQKFYHGIIRKSIIAFGNLFNNITIDRFNSRSANYFRLVQNYQYHTRYSTKNIYTYSFGLYPERQQPSGTCNMSKITNLILYLDYTGSNTTGQNQILKVYGVNYNILRIMSGMGGLSFSN